MALEHTRIVVDFLGLYFETFTRIENMEGLAWGKNAYKIFDVSFSNLIYENFFHRFLLRDRTTDFKNV